MYSSDRSVCECARTCVCEVFYLRYQRVHDKRFVVCSLCLMIFQVSLPVIDASCLLWTVSSRIWSVVGDEKCIFSEGYFRVALK